MNEIYFITSNRTKLMHARHLSRDYDVLVCPQKHYGVGYKEPKISDREKLLEDSIKDAMHRLEKAGFQPFSKILFIEDTSVIIKSLSTDEEYPGTDIKFWMRENDFSSVDSMLKSVSNDRRVEVRSDIVLCFPQNNTDSTLSFKRFTSSARGSIVEHEFMFNTNLLYPWLDNKTFNKWFVPDGCNVPISMLPIIEADKHDFRAGAFNQMFVFLEERHLIHKRKGHERPSQKKLFPDKTPLFIVSGLPCAGKTTLGIKLSEMCGYHHIEASDFMHLSYYQRHGASTADLGSFAALALKEIPSIVVDQIIEFIEQQIDIPLVITGFRSPFEIEYFIKNYTGAFRVEPLFIDADLQNRFERSVKRGRNDRLKTIDEFKKRDELQLEMGIKDIKKNLSGRIMENNSTIEEFIGTVFSMYDLKSSDKNILRYETLDFKKPRLEHAIILSMASNLMQEDNYLTTTEIAHLTNQVFSGGSLKTSKNNVSRYFNQDFYPYFEIYTEKNKNKYRLSQTGISQAKLLLFNYQQQNFGNKE